MADILNEILKQIPKGKISDSVFEGANIVLYTKNKDFLFNSNGLIKEIVNSIKKRVELRPDPALTLDQEEAEKKIKKIIPKEANISNIIFDPQRSRVIIEAEKPGLAIGKQGDLLKEIKQNTLWVPLIKRTPALKSKIIENIRYVLYENSEFRRKFLNQVGKRIYDGWKKEKKEEWIRLSVLGAGREVGRSCFLLQTPESRVLLDAGVNAAKNLDDPSAYPYMDIPEFKIEELDAIIISHPHIDHCALVPYLYKMGYKGPVYCTAPTRDIMALLCLDTIKIAQAEGRNPLYSSSDIKDMVKHTICLDYEEVTDITPDVRLTFYDAGHGLGSALSHLHIGNGLHNFVYAGDFNYEVSNLLAAANTKFPRLETIMIESTYGAKDDVHQSRKETEDYLLDLLNKTIKRGGKVLMPTLGYGRSQEIMIIIERAMRNGLIPKVPVYIQGMVWDITAIHTTYPDFFNAKVKGSIFHKDHNPFLSDIFQQITSREDQKKVIESGEPCIIMATSGMLVGGASVEYFKHLAENPNNTIILTSYQGEGSLGRRIENGAKEIDFGSAEKPEIIPVKMETHSIHGLTGHSSRTQLMNYIGRLDPKPKKVIIVHGESSKCLDLASSLHKAYRIETSAPKNLESVRIK